MSKSSIHSLLDLQQAGFISEVSDDLHRVAKKFSIAITPAMIEAINPANEHDPIAAQFVPSAKELRATDAERADPIGDHVHSPVEGIVHRYPDRVLFKLLHVCPAYCRFCFRREQVGTEAGGGVLSLYAIDQAIAYIAAHTEIWEVILSGGDPLMLSDRRLKDVLDRLRVIPHVKVLRIHSRVPVVDPARITLELTAILSGEKPTYILVHCNHVQELTVPARAACAMLVDAGIPLLSQSVLLRGVNDNAETLSDLMRAFVECRIKPHYLHHPDLARGTQHFRVSIDQGQQLMRDLRGHLSGLCQPTYILDIPGGHGKVPVGPVYAEAVGKGWQVEDYRGIAHAYHSDEGDA